MRRVFRRLGTVRNRITDFYYDLVLRKGSEIAAGLAYFITLGAVPYFYILSRLASLFGTSVAFGSLGFVSDFFAASECARSKAAVTVFFVAAAAFSSYKLFFRILRSGETLYNYKRSDNARYRYFLTFLAMLALTAAAVVALAANSIFKAFALRLGGFGNALSEVVSAGLTFLMVLLLNYYVCPVRARFGELWRGSAFTVLFSLLFGFGFGLYLDKFSSFEALYGKLSLVVVFLFYIYFICYGFVVGVVINIRSSSRRRMRRTARAEKL